MLRQVLRSTGPIDPRQGFASLGMDSLMAMEFRALLVAALETALPTTVAFSYPTLDALVAFLAAQTGIDPERGAGGQAASTGQARGTGPMAGSGPAGAEPPGDPGDAGPEASELIAAIQERFRAHQDR
jgi:acyl carrier protein